MYLAMRWLSICGLVVGLGLVLAGRASADPCADTNLFNCYKKSVEGPTGVPIKWLTMPIKFYVNASLLPADKKQKAIDEVKAAFAAFELPCTELKFNYEGESTSFSEEAGAILVYWGDSSKDPSSWIYGNAAYWREFIFTSYTTGEISKGWLAMNVKDYGWAAGSDIVVPPPSGTGKIDIRTALMWMIPDVLGFYVGTDTGAKKLPINYNETLSDICQATKDGATFTYYKDTGASCTQPTTPNECPGTEKMPPDTGPKEAGPDYTWPDFGLPDAGPDGGYLPPPVEDDGCCRVSHGRSASFPLLAVLGIGIVLLLLRRRR